MFLQTNSDLQILLLEGNGERNTNALRPKALTGGDITRQVRFGITGNNTVGIAPTSLVTTILGTIVIPSIGQIVVDIVCTLRIRNLDLRSRVDEVVVINVPSRKTRIRDLIGIVQIKPKFVS